MNLIIQEPIKGFFPSRKPKSNSISEVEGQTSLFVVGLFSVWEVARVNNLLYTNSQNYNSDVGFNLNFLYKILLASNGQR